MAAGILDAAAAFDERLPELFGGLGIDELPAPVRYSHAGVPQAWATTATTAVARLVDRSGRR